MKTASSISYFDNHCTESVSDLFCYVIYFWRRFVVFCKAVVYICGGFFVIFYRSVFFLLFFSFCLVVWIYLVSFRLVLWHINNSRLFNAKSIFIHTNSSISNNSVNHKYSILFTQLNLKTVLFQAIQFSISTLFSSI